MVPLLLVLLSSVVYTAPILPAVDSPTPDATDYEYPSYEYGSPVVEKPTRLQAVARRIPFAALAALCRRRVDARPPTPPPLPRTRNPDLAPILTQALSEIMGQVQRSHTHPQTGRVVLEGFGGIPLPLGGLKGDFSAAFKDPYLGCRFLEKMKSLRDPGGALFFALGLMELFMLQ